MTSIALPGSKSLTQRALVAAALARGRSVVRSPLVADDIEVTVAALRAMGAAVTPLAGDDLAVDGVAGAPRPPDRPIDLGDNGTAMRLLVAVAALGEGDFAFTGSARLAARPLAPLLAALGSLGARWTRRRGEDRWPLVVHGRGLAGGRVVLGDLDSSQPVSAVLLAAPCARGDVEVALAGRRVSEPYVGLTLDVMREFGATWQRLDAGRILVRGGTGYRPAETTVEGDASAAALLLLAGALAGGPVTVTGVGRASRQGDLAWLDVLHEAGCRVDAGAREVTVRRTGPLAAGDRDHDLAGTPDLAPPLAALAAVRPGRTTLRGAPHLRAKESDRIAALVAALRALGVAAGERDDGLAIEGGAPRAGLVPTRGDHRIAMAFAALGLAVPGLRVDDPTCVAKSYPRFWDDLARLPAPRNVVLIGARGAGKTAVGARLAAGLGRPLLDTDALVVAAAGRPIADLVASGGWEAFRAAERAAVATLAPTTGAVIALGGGAVLDARNVAVLRPRARLVWLDADAAVLAARLRDDPGRPPLTAAGDAACEVAAVVARRRPLYAALADVRVDTTVLTVDEAAAAVAASLGPAT